MVRKTINVGDRTHAQLVDLAGERGGITGVFTTLVAWAWRQDAELRAQIFERLSPEAEIKLLELLIDRARRRAELGDEAITPHLAGRPVYHGEEIEDEDAAAAEPATKPAKSQAAPAGLVKPKKGEISQKLNDLKPPSRR